MTDSEVIPHLSYPPTVQLLDTQFLIHRVSVSSEEKRASSDSPFFAKLPLELRIKIYRHAFGNRTFHMGFEFSGPTAKSTKKPYHAAIDGDIRGARRSRASEPRKWRWSGSVCHRNMSLPLWTDTCQDGAGICARAPGPPAVPGICYVGAMGWIQSCRQA